jgi:hypothetical protein
MPSKDGPREWTITKQVKQGMEYKVLGVLVMLDGFRFNKKEVLER